MALFVIAQVWNLWRTDHWKVLFLDYLIDRVAGNRPDSSTETPAAKGDTPKE